MTAYIARRALITFVTLLVASAVVFLVMQVLPGDPASVILGTGARTDTLAALRHQLGLDAPAWLRYLRWLAGLAVGRFGESTTYHVPVAELIGERVLVSLPLALLAVVLSTAIALPTGIFAAARRGRVGDAAVMGVAQIGVAIPDFWLGLLLVLAFAVRLPWLPAGGFPGWESGALPALRALILPAFALALPQAAILARVTRSVMIETMGQDFMRTARAKGRSARAALWREALPNALVPILTVLGLQVSFLVAGAVIVENVFTLPGLGRLVFQAIAQRDLLVVQDLVVLLAGSVILVNFLVDLAAAAIDARLRDAI